MTTAEDKAEQAAQDLMQMVEEREGRDRGSFREGLNSALERIGAYFVLSELESIESEE